MLTSFITRRTFAKTLGVGLAATALPLRASTKLNVGIGTYSYHNLSLDQMIVQLNALKVAEIEMSRGEFMLMNHPTDDLKGIAASVLDGKIDDARIETFRRIVDRGDGEFAVPAVEQVAEPEGERRRLAVLGRRTDRELGIHTGSGQKSHCRRDPGDGAGSAVS